MQFPKSIKHNYYTPKWKVYSSLVYIKILAQSRINYPLESLNKKFLKKSMLKKVKSRKR